MQASICAGGGLANGLARCRAKRDADHFSRSTTASEYGAPGTTRPQRTFAVRPPPPAPVMHVSRSESFPLASHSHSVHSGPGKAASDTPAAGQYSSPAQPTTRNHISADRRLETRSTTTRDNFQATQRPSLPAVLVRKPAAPPNRFTHRATDDCHSSYTSCDAGSTPEEGRAVSQRRRYVVTENAGCCPITGSSWCSGRERELETGGEKGSPFSTTNSATYRGHQERVGRAEICTKHSSHLSSITHGDPRKVKECSTTNRATYQEPSRQATPPSHAYSRAAAVATFLHSSVHLGACPSLPPSTSERAAMMEDKQPGRERERVRERVYRNASFLPEGDLERERVRERLTHSTTRNTHRAPPAGSYPAHVDTSRKHTASSVSLGLRPHHQAPPTSTMATSYLPRPGHTHRVRAPIQDNIPFDYFPGHLLDSTAASSYRTHVGDLRHSLPPNTLRNLKISHW